MEMEAVEFSYRCRLINPVLKETSFLGTSEGFTGYQLKAGSAGLKPAI